MPLNKDLREFIELLNANGVEYLIVGGYAVAYHGHPRYTDDIDFLVRPSAENAERVVTVLKQFGFATLSIQVEDLSSPDKVVQLGVPPNRIDLMTSISGVTFDEAWETRVEATLEGLPTRFLARTPLLRNKETTGRDEDLVDAKKLRRRPPPKP